MSARSAKDLLAAELEELATWITCPLKACDAMRRAATALRDAPETRVGPSDKQVSDALALRCDWLATRLQTVGAALQRLIEAGDQIEIPAQQLGSEPVFTVIGRLKDQLAFNRAMADAREALKDSPSEKANEQATEDRS